MSGALTIVFRSCIAIVCSTISAISFPLKDPLVNIIIVDKIIRCSKYNKPFVFYI
jgi:hypothetical protein